MVINGQMSSSSQAPSALTALLTVGLAVALSQLSIRNGGTPVLFRGGTSEQTHAGWSQLAFLVAEGRKGCLCCDGGVAFLPDADAGVEISAWRPLDKKNKRNVTVPTKEGRKETKELYQTIQIWAREPGAQEDAWAVGETDAYCVQTCVPNGLRIF